MRRKDREVTDKQELLAIIENCKVCRLAMVDEGKPYMLPINFGFDWQGESLILYFHCAKEGKKLDVLRKNNQVCFEMDGKHVLIEGGTACQYGFAFESIIGFGQAFIVTENQEKEEALKFIMKQQAALTDLSFPPQMLDSVAVIKLVTAELSGKCKH